MTRAEKVAIAQAFRGQGLLLREIAERMGVAISTAHTYVDDPDLSKSRARKARYRGKCLDCGGPTSWSGPTRCKRCAGEHRCHWTRGRIIEAIEDFAVRYGRQPTASDWNPSAAIAQGHPETAERFYADGCWPSLHTAQRVFGSWNAAMAAAGFEPFRSGYYPRNLEAAA